MRKVFIAFSIWIVGMGCLVGAELHRHPLHPREVTTIIVDPPTIVEPQHIPEYDTEVDVVPDEPETDEPAEEENPTPVVWRI